jgi:hypothetical protein
LLFPLHFLFQEHLISQIIQIASLHNLQRAFQGIEIPFEQRVINNLPSKKSFKRLLKADAAPEQVLKQHGCKNLKVKQACERVFESYFPGGQLHALGLHFVATTLQADIGRNKRYARASTGR